MLLARMRKPAEIPLIGDDWSKGDMKLIPWGVGPHSTGNPALVTMLPTGAAVLTARMIAGKWNTGALQLNKPARGKGRWGAIVSSTAANNVNAFFTYCDRTGTELDFEYVIKNGVKGWALGVHMPLTAGGGQRGFGGLFVPFSDGDFSKPTLLEFELDETSCRFFINGRLVGTVTEAMMPSVCTWTVTSRMEMFLSSEWHGSWAGWTADDYAKGSNMTVYGIVAPA